MKHLLILISCVVLVFSNINTTKAQTTLSAGDIVIVAINGDTDATYGRGFSFMPLLNLEAGTEIYFTDYGWSDVAGAFINSTAVSDVFVKYTAPAGGVTAGTVIRNATNSTTNFVFYFAYGISTFNYVNIVGVAASDEVLAFQGSIASPTFLFAASYVSTDVVASGWATNVAATGGTNGVGSALPGTGNASVTDLVDDVTALSFNRAANDNDNCAYTGPTTATDKAGWQARISNYSNWTFNDVVPIPTPPSGPFTVVEPVTIPTVTTTAASSIASTSATLGGNVTADGGASVTERGIVYSTTDATPTIEEGATKVIMGSGTGPISQSVGSLTPGTLHYFNAYATNSAGTSYGDVATFITLPEADPLQTLYWPNYEGNKIEGISIMGTNRTAVASTPLMDPISIEVDAENEKVYWFSQNEYKIYRANTDGSNIEIFISDPGYATTLFLDRKNGYLYWPNYEAAKIERIKIDGTSREDVIPAPQPIAITVDLTNEKIYWFDQEDYKIHRADLDGAHSEVFVADPGYATTLYFDQLNKVLYWPNYEATKIERINTDGTSRQNVVNAPQPISITADITNGKIYWFDQEDYKIHRADLDGAHSEVFVADPGYATTIILPYEIQSTTPPEVTTALVATYSAISATMGGEVTSDGGASVTDRGVVYSSTDNTPEIGEPNVNKEENGSGTGIFGESVTGLSSSTTHYVRAYATNSAGTSYGDVVSFTTLTNGTFTGSVSNDWATAGNWGGGSVPTSATDVTIPSGKTAVIAAGTSADCNNITVNAGGSLTIQSSSATNAGSLIVAGTASGNVSFESYLAETAKWHVVAAPVTDQNIWNFATLAGNSIAENAGKRATTEYNEGTNTWNTNYPTADTEGSFSPGTGYTVLRSTPGVVTYTGAINTSDISKPLTRDLYGWNALGNPYTSAINATISAHATNNLITANTDNFDPSFAALYVWDAATNTYVTINNAGTGTLVQNHIQAGQGFFIRAKDNSGLTFSITEAMQTPQPTVPLKSADESWPVVQLTATGNSKQSSTVVTFNRNMTTGLDITYDAGMFKADKNFALYTRLVDDNGVDFAIQALPDNRFNDLVIPLSIDVPVGTEIIFSAMAMNLPAEAAVYLEDRANKTMTQLDVTNAKYTVAINEQTKGAGNFYLHTSSATTAISELENNLKVYTRNRSIFINGNINASDVISVFGIDGKIHYRKNAEKTGLLRIDTAKMPAGVYLISIEQKAGRITQKVVISE